MYINGVLQFNGNESNLFIGICLDESRRNRRVLQQILDLFR